MSDSGAERPSAEVALEALKIGNPRARLADLIVMADALAIYVEASNNVREFGAIVTHPKTAATIENPYLQIQRNAGATMRKMSNLKIDGALAALGWSA